MIISLQFKTTLKQQKTEKIEIVSEEQLTDRSTNQPTHRPKKPTGQKTKQPTKQRT